MWMSAKQHWLALRDLLGRYRTVLSLVWKDRHAFDSAGFTREEAEFLPAALAIQETPVSPAPRAALWMLIAFTGIAFAWSVLGHIDIVAVAHGKIILSGRTKVIQSLEAGSVRRILVKEGEFVRAGDVLVELDERTAVADVQRIEGDRMAYELQAERARHMIEALRTGSLAQARDRAGNGRIAESRRLLEWQYEEYRSKAASLEAEMAKRQAELVSMRALVRKLELTAPIARQRAEDFRRLVDANFVSQHGYLEREQLRIEQEADLDNLRGRERELEASLRDAQAQAKRLEAETRRLAFDALNDAQQKIAALEQEQRKAGTRAELMKITAPVDGIVQQLDVHTVGGVVTPAQKLMVLVPSDGALEAEVYLPNKDVGFVRAGQEAAVKVDTFEYTKYGIIPSRVLHVSRDAIHDEKAGLVYSMRVGLDRSSVEVQGSRVPLAPGMSVTAEVKIGSRRVLEYFLSPLMQYASESLGER